MGKMDGFFNVTGSVSNLSFYQMKGTDKIIVRTKGGAPKNKIKRSPRFEKTRQNNSEWTGCSQTGAWLRRNFAWHSYVADYNVSGPINGLMKRAQLLDTDHEKGQRSVLLSKNPRILDGFSFNKKYPIESIIRTPLRHHISRTERKATITFPELIPGVNFFPSPYYTFFQLLATLVLVPDHHYTTRNYLPHPAYQTFGCRSIVTDWLTVQKTLPEVELVQQISFIPPDEGYSLALCATILYGKPAGGDKIEPAKAGAAKIIATA